jgi:outer membrane immunogenic protein
MAHAIHHARALLLGVAAIAATAATAEPFNGPYLGAEIGWQQDRLRSSVTADGRTFSTTDRGDVLSYGAVAGYDARVSEQFVLGGEVSVTGAGGQIVIPDTGGIQVDPRRTFGLAARAGVLASPNTLVYARGGWANGRFSLNDGGERTSRNRDGWTIGGGVEQVVAPNVSLKGEYRYSQFGRFRADVSDFDVDALSARFTRHQLVAGVNFRF